MKTRIISAIVMLAILIPIFIAGGDFFRVLVVILAMLGMKEYLDIKEEKKQLPILMKLLAYLFIPLILLCVSIDSDLMLNIDFRIITGLFLVMLLPVVIYHNRKIYSINDACYLFFGIMFLGIAMSLFNTYYFINKYLLLYLVLITTMTDSFALFTGMLIGRHKLLEVISPKKTWEGLVGGAVFGTFIGTAFYVTVINQHTSIALVAVITLFLSIVGQFGDLFFSAIKRYFDKKDFSNLIPGHGGILDRLDSLIFLLLAFAFFLNVL